MGKKPQRHTWPEAKESLPAQLEPPAPVTFEYDEEAARRFEEELYWEDYWDRNRDSVSSGTRGDTAGGARKYSPTVDATWKPVEIADDDVPF